MVSNPERNLPKRWQCRDIGYVQAWDENQAAADLRRQTEQSEVQEAEPECDPRRDVPFVHEIFQRLYSISADTVGRGF